MNYHLLIDDKFINDFIDESEAISEPHTNIYLIRNDERNATHVTHPKALWAAPGSQLFTSLTSKITRDDKVFIHWLSYDACELILQLDKEIPVYAVVWGADFYEEPKSIHKHWLYDKHTKQYVNRTYGKPQKWARNPLCLLQQFKQLREFKKHEASLYQLKKKAVQRLNYILLPEPDTAEVEQTINLYKAPQLKHLPFNYNQNVDFALSIYEQPKKSIKKQLVIQLGNSATDTNNHVDALLGLKRFKNENIKINIPLSYGDTAYRDFVIKYANNFLGQTVNFITTFQPREEYLKTIKEVDVVVMFHNRSQALGNCVALLALGKKLFIKRSNPLWVLFKNLGVEVFDACDIERLNFDEFAKPLSEAQIRKNQDQLSKEFSISKRLLDLSKIFQS